jgi:excisionase family DNA binding protein
MPNESIPPIKGWVTARQIAVRYGVTKPTVFNWLHAGVIQAKVAVGRIFRFDLDEVDAALAQRTGKTTRNTLTQASGRKASQPKQSNQELGQ